MNTDCDFRDSIFAFFKTQVARGLCFELKRKIQPGAGTGWIY